MSVVQWLPLESNPEVMSKFLANLGMSKEWTIVDVIGTDDDLLALIPQPVASVILLFPTADEDTDEAKGTNDGDEKSSLEKVYFMRQTIRNACGTIALIHAVGNNTDKISFEPNSTLKAFIDSTLTLAPHERGKLLEQNEDICSAHESSAREGQTDAPDIDANVNHHFIAFVERDGHLYELDGRKEVPINHGTTSLDTFLRDAVGVCRKYMQKNPENLNFNIVALAKE